VSSPRLSICIPTFERLGYLQQAVASAQAQTADDVEILIGDDGDSGDLAAWCRAAAVADARIRYQKTPRRLRLAGNWNFLAGLARGEYLTLMGDDDRLLPEFAARLLREADAGGKTDVVFSNHHVIDGLGRRSEEKARDMTAHYGRGELAPGVLPDPEPQVWRNAVPLMASIVKAEPVRRLAFKNDINAPELELFVRMAAEGARFAFVPDYLAEYRSHEGSETSSGLTIDRLAEYLEAVDVGAEVEPAKRACLAPLLVGGVSLRLRRGDVEGARALRRSRYYPISMGEPRALVQRLVLKLPDALASTAYASLRRVDQTLKTLRGRGGENAR
jgi:glycosyltransferase involved in cell wall biosynthesis